MEENEWSLRDLYRTLEVPGSNPLKDAQDALDNAVRKAYGMKEGTDYLRFLLDLNGAVAKGGLWSKQILGPGLPPFVTDRDSFISSDCVQPIALPVPVPGKKMAGSVGRERKRKPGEPIRKRR